jgi:hypothetical protein
LACDLVFVVTEIEIEEAERSSYRKTALLPDPNLCCKEGIRNAVTTAPNGRQTDYYSDPRSSPKPNHIARPYARGHLS